MGWSGPGILTSFTLLDAVVIVYPPLSVRALNRRTTSSSRKVHRLRDTFAIAQISLSLLLTIGAALMCKSMWSMLHMADTHQPTQVLTLHVYLPSARFATKQKMSAWFNTSLEQLRGLPGVTHAEITTTLPDGQETWDDDFNIENRTLMPGKYQSATRIAVSEGYFNVMHIPIVSGHTFLSSDTVDTEPIAIVSHRFAELYFPGENPIGHRIRLGDAITSHEPWVRIVGIAADVSYLWIDRSVEPVVYLNVAQLPPTQALYLISTSGDPLSLATSARQLLTAVDSSVPIDTVQTYQHALQEGLAGHYFAAVWLLVDALICLLLAAIGIFGVMANSVAEQTREIGLRMAVGATPRNVLTLILRRAATLTAAGVIIGFVLAAVMARFGASLLFGVSPSDPLIFFSVSATVATIALLASWGPIRRAVSIDPMTAIRTE
jgi:putative ABC transport system permease protein